MTISYAAVGSSAGIAAFTARQVNFGASDVPMTSAEQAAATGGPSPGARRPRRRSRRLQPRLPAGPGCTSPAWSSPAIFLGQITSWHDPAITALNPGLDSPRPRRSPSCTAPTAAAPPTSSVTTSPASTPPGPPRSAPARPCTGRPGKARKATPAWPPRSSAPRSPSDTSNRPTPQGTAAAVRRHPQPGRPLRHPYHPVRHRRRRPKAQHHPGRLLHRQPARTEQLPHQRVQLGTRLHPPAEPGHRPGTGQLLDWLTHHGQAYAAATSYVPLPPRSSNLARTTLQQVTGPGGTRLQG